MEFTSTSATSVSLSEELRTSIYGMGFSDRECRVLG